MITQRRSTWLSRALVVIIALFGLVLPASAANAATAIEQTAASWARSQTGSTSYQYQCLKFVYQAYISAGMSRATIDANARYIANANSYPIDEWNYWMSGHLPAGQLHQGYDASPPVGAIIYFSNKLGHDYSHATISLGGGQQISPDTSSVSGPQSVNTNSYRTMLGWWLPEGSSAGGGGGGSRSSANMAFNGGFESGWGPWTAMTATNYVDYRTGQVSGESARSGLHYGATNTSQSGGGIYQDVAVSASAGNVYCASSWVRTQYPATGASGSFVVWLLGGSYNENGVASFTGLSNGANWRQVQTCVSASTAHSQMRIQLYPTVNGPTVDIDDVDVH